MTTASHTRTFPDPGLMYQLHIATITSYVGSRFAVKAKMMKRETRRWKKRCKKPAIWATSEMDPDSSSHPYPTQGPRTTSSRSNHNTSIPHSFSRTQSLSVLSFSVSGLPA
ncbi:hypothetical protein K435DRAFT_524693 [Dendrothele bispora CBS 962.96]|uniref:Uncharacterized protein n=1 Tax=Dendrothele bispora (strain CBS 962.96) TaxID=1314807 RepID=A0A4S8M8L3_DENBC|nr:hypothetical protein K435DRAFT_524693 [Dendrothele bispora CBS 962.96]